MEFATKFLIIAVLIFTVLLVAIVVILEKTKRKPDGTLFLDLSGESVPIQLKLDIGINQIMQRKYITLKTEIININIPVETTDKD